jgi:hypothetical protein
MKLDTINVCDAPVTIPDNTCSCTGYKKSESQEEEIALEEVDIQSKMLETTTSSSSNVDNKEEVSSKMDSTGNTTTITVAPNDSITNNKTTNNARGSKKRLHESIEQDNSEQDDTQESDCKKSKQEGYLALLCAMCRNDETNTEEAKEFLVRFKNEAAYEMCNDTGFDDLIGPLNHSLKDFYVDDVIEPVTCNIKKHHLDKYTIVDYSHYDPDQEEEEEE